MTKDESEEDEEEEDEDDEEEDESDEDDAPRPASPRVKEDDYDEEPPLSVQLEVDAGPGCGGIAWPAGEVSVCALINPFCLYTVKI